MWPFSDPDHQIPANVNVPKVGPAPLGDPRDLKLIELEQRLFGMECAIIEVCKALKMHQDVCNINFQAVEKSFLNLVSFVTRPRASIMGEQRESN
jgi:hypothetical protein